jgi:acyl-CoA reductase-like NAD-dependent aldehyde dehydrogenase
MEQPWPMTLVFVVHTLAHAVAALVAGTAAGVPIVLLSAPCAGLSAGAGWFSALIAAAREAMPAARCTALLDCGDDAGAAQAALRSDVDGIVFAGRVNVAERLAHIAAQRGGRLLAERPVALLDLCDGFFAAPEMLRQRCSAALASPLA